MFSFLKFLNSKSDADKKKGPNSLTGKTLNLNSPAARGLDIFNNRSPIARKSNGSNTSLRSNCKETVTSPGFSFRIAQKAQELRSTTPNLDTSNLSTSYTLENSLNGSNIMNGNKTDIYDKKRKLMETLDNFGVRKRTRQEVIYKGGVDTFANRRRRTISESNAPDHVIVMNGHNHRPIPTVTSSNSVNVENKKTKRQGDFGTNILNHPQKKPRTRNNEILSSYSSSKFLVTAGQKRPYPSDHEEESPDRKHCKSCTCCGSTVILNNDQSSLNKSDKTTETDMSDDLVTVAASRIFNRSGKTQIVKKMCMKTILDEVFDDPDPIPYTSIEKLEERRKKVISVEQHVDKTNLKKENQSDSAAFVPLAITSTFNEIQPAVTSISSIASTTSPVIIAPLITTPEIQSPKPLTFGLHSSESTPKVIEGNKNNTALQFSFGSQITSPVVSVEENHKQTNELRVKEIDSQTPKSTNNELAIKTQNSTEQSLNEQNKLQFQSSEKNINANVGFQIGGQKNFNNDEDIPSFKFTIPSSKPSEPIINSSTVSASSTINHSNLHAVQLDTEKSTDNSTKIASPSLVFGSQIDNSSKQPSFGIPKSDDKQSTPVMQFGTPKANEKQTTPVMQFGLPKSDENQSTSVTQFGIPKVVDKQSTPILQFGATKVDNNQLSPIMQFGAPKVGDKPSTPIMQFGTTKVNDKQSTPIMQFGATNVNDKQSTSIMQFGATKVNDKESTPVLQFGATKTDQSTHTLPFDATKGSGNPTSTPTLFSFGNNQKSNETTKPTEPVKFQFGSSKPDNAPSTESTNAVFGANAQNQNLFNFGKTDNITLPTGNPPKYSATAEKSTPKIQFGASPATVFGVSTADQSKPQFNTPVSQAAINQGPKVVFGSQIDENKPTAAPGMLFANNTENPLFQFNNSGSKLGDKPSETTSGTFAFPSTKTSTSFGASAKSAFQFSDQKTEQPKTQFSTPAFGSQSTSAPFKFGGNEKPVSFGATFPSSNPPLTFANNTEKTEPFKFGSSVPTSNAFQFSANKTDNGPVKFGQTSNTFATPGFSGFGNSTPQQPPTSFGTVPSSQPSPFGNMASPSAAPAFGSVASPPSNTFGTNQSFQFGSTNNNAPSSSSTFAFGSNPQPTKPDGTFSFNAAASSTAAPFQFGQAPQALSTPQFGGTQPNQGSFGFGSPPMTASVMPGSSQPLFSMGTAPAGERRKAKAVRRRQ